MSNPSVELTHRELSLLVFALEGAADAASLSDESPSCEEACPVADHFEELFHGGAIPHEKRLVNHLNNHLREGLIECGAFEMIASQQGNFSQPPSAEDQRKMQEVNERLKSWHCRVRLDEADRRALYESIRRLPRSAWIAMPRTLWRLKKKLKAR
jgi:hypothetical protein